jgi:hypothetical protein
MLTRNWLIGWIGIVALLALAFAAFNATAARADGAGSPNACLSTNDLVFNVDAEDEGQSEDSVSFTAPAGYLADGACIKAGQLHTGPLGDGTYDGDGNPVAAGDPAACFVVSGVGTATATVARIGGGRTCQGISHVDFVIVEEPREPQWCSPGYWRNHLDEAAVAAAAGGFSLSDTYSSHFGAAPARTPLGVREGVSTDPTLLQVLARPQWYNSGAFNNVGDLLSAAHPDVDFTGERGTCPLS